MRDDDHGLAFARKVQDDVEHFVHHLGVERGGDLVEQHDLGFHGKGARNGHALLLPAGELARVVVALVEQPHALEQGLSFRNGLFFRTLLHHDGRERHVFDDGLVREQIVALKHHTQPLANLGDAFGTTVNLVIVQQDAPALDFFQPVDAAQKRGLAATRRADDHDDLAWLNRQVESVNDNVVTELLAKLLDSKYALVCHNALSASNHHQQKSCDDV